MTDEYLVQLANYTDPLVSIPESRFQTRSGDYVYRNRKTSEWILISPPIYVAQSETIAKALEIEKFNLNARLQFQRNNIALSSVSPGERDVAKKYVESYNANCELLGKTNARLEVVSNFNSGKTPIIIKLNEDIDRLKAENLGLRTVQKIGMDMVTTGKLHDLGIEINDLYNTIQEQGPIQDMNPSSHEGKVKEDLIKWYKLNDEYVKLNTKYQDNLKMLEELNIKLLNQELNAFKQGTGTVKTISNTQAEELRRFGTTEEPITSSQSIPASTVVAQTSSTSQPKKTLIKIKPKVAVESQVVNALAGSPDGEPSLDSNIQSVSVTAKSQQPEAPVIPLKPSDTVAPEKPSEGRKIKIKTIYEKDVKKCVKGPSAGGYAIDELRKIATELGIDIKGRKKEEICADIERVWATES